MTDAELYVLGALPPGEAMALEARMEWEPELRAQVEELRNVAAALALTAPRAEPPAGLKDRLLARVAGLTLVRDAEAPWAPSGVPGVDVRFLFRDEEQSRHTVLVRLAPGAVYPCHRHAGAEECYVISGDLMDGDLPMATGDFTRYAEGSEHGPLRSERGCLILVTASMHDETY